MKNNTVAGATPQDVIRMFDRISPVYDMMNRMMSLGMDRGWRRKAVTALKIQSGSRVLDLACGTGDMSLEAQNQQPDIKIVGVDPSPAMMAVGRPRYSRNGVVLVRSWGEHLPFADSSFHRAMMAFGIRSFPDRKIAVTELHRVVAPGGKLAILEMTSRKRSIPEALFGWYFRGLVPLIGAIISRDKRAYRYLPASVDAFPQPLDFGREIIESGWKSVQWTPMAGGVVSLFVAEK